MSKRELFRIGGEITCWAEQGTSVHLKAVSPDGDPVELTAAEARKLAKILNQLADRIT